MSPPTPRAIEERIAREKLVHQALARMSSGESQKAAARAVGLSPAKLCRLLQRYHELGADGLTPLSANAGRPRAHINPQTGLSEFTADDIAYVKRLFIKTESLPLALERLSDAGTCSAAARDLIDKYRHSGDYPPSFYTLFHLTENEWAAAKGEKTIDYTPTHTARRGMWYIDADGKRVELFAGDVQEADDVSVDCPYYVELPDGTFSVGRQVLCFRDLARRKWTGAYAVARERDSYRGEDIARACRELVDAWGLPAHFRFERGTWESNAIEGIKVDDGRGSETRWGGITSVVPVRHVFRSRGKGGVEGAFRMLHKVLGLSGVRIGKCRGEYEAPTADMLAVNAGKKHPRDCGFIAWSDLLGVFEQAFTLLNTRPVYFQELGRKMAPDDAWAQDMAARPGGKLPALDASLAWHFLPVKREVGASIAQAGHVKISVEGYPLPFFFRIGGPVVMFAGDGIPAEGMERNAPFIERGHRLIVAFDPQRAAEGAFIFNAERGPKNTQGWRPFQKLMLAPLAAEAPQFNLRPGEAGASDDLVAKKSRDQQVRAAFTSIGLYGQGARRTRQDHDGRGNVARVESGASSRTASAAKAVRGQVAAAVQSARIDPALIEDFTAPAGPRIPQRAQVAQSAPLEEW